jgi:hypothetical protein
MRNTVFAGACCFGPLDAERHLLNIQPVIPTKLSADWNSSFAPSCRCSISKPPCRPRQHLRPRSHAANLLLLAQHNTPSGVTWGVGPAIAWPTRTDPLIDSGKWSAGPTFVIFKQQSGWTYGALASQIWSFADAGGPNNRPDGTEPSSSSSRPIPERIRPPSPSIRNRRSTGPATNIRCRST